MQSDTTPKSFVDTPFNFHPIVAQSESAQYSQHDDLRLLVLLFILENQLFTIPQSQVYHLIKADRLPDDVRLGKILLACQIFRGSQRCATGFVM